MRAALATTALTALPARYVPGSEALDVTYASGADAMLTDEFLRQVAAALQVPVRYLSLSPAQSAVPVYNGANPLRPR